MRHGLYIHIPFCRRKCPYCDFYSVDTADEAVKRRYADAVCAAMAEWGREAAGCVFDTVYFGGGTPPLLGADNLCRILDAAGRAFSIQSPEITLEANPESTDEVFLRTMLHHGVNRLSVGLQSANDDERRLLGRHHTAEQARRLLETAVSLGCSNLSVDLMAALPGQSEDTLRRSVAYAASLPVTHLSAYLLKIEPDTPFARQNLTLPDEDASAELYLALCDAAEQAGFAQYEISNFAKPGCESRHNTKYWDCAPYLGIGPAAHSFFAGRRFYYPRTLSDWQNSMPPQPEPDGEGGSLEEYLMLRLRLAEGVMPDALEARYGVSTTQFAALQAALRPLEQHGLLSTDGGALRLTRNGFLLSNAVIEAVLEAAESMIAM